MAWADLTAGELFAQLPDPALLVRVDGTIAAANRRAAELFEVPEPFPETNTNIEELLTQPERARLDALTWMKKWATTPDAPELDYVYLTCRTQQGNEKQLGVRVSRIVTDDTYYLVTLRDTSVAESRLRAERHAHRLAARVLAISSDAVITTDDEYRITSVNASAQTLFGYSAAELMGASLNRLLPERFREAHGEHMRRFAGETTPSRLMGDRSMIWGLARDGTEFPVEASITRLIHDERAVFSAHLRDMRPRLAREAELEESDTQFRVLFDEVDQAMALLEANGSVLSMNPAALKLLDRPQQVVGRDFDALSWFSRDAEATRGALERGLQACRAGQIFRMTPTINVEDRELDLDVSMRPISRAGEVFSILVVAQVVATDAAVPDSDA